MRCASTARRLLPIFDGTPTVKAYLVPDDPRVRIAVDGSDSRGPIGFKVSFADGRVLTFGATADARIEGPRVFISGIEPFPGPGFEREASRLGWSVSRIEDRYGNALSVSYETSTAQPILHRPKQIDYVRRDGASAVRSVRFGYEDRPDSIGEFVGGIKVVETKRLSSIEMIGPAPVAPAVLKSYRMQYHPGGSISGRSLLSTIAECDGQDKCKAPISFEWERGSLTFTETPFPGIRIDPRGLTNTLQVLDLNNRRYPLVIRWLRPAQDRGPATSGRSRRQLQQHVGLAPRGDPGTRGRQHAVDLL